jgi:hypothetical protein
VLEREQDSAAYLRGSFVNEIVNSCWPSRTTTVPGVVSGASSRAARNVDLAQSAPNRLVAWRFTTPVFDVFDEGSQFRRHLVSAGIVEKHTRRHRRERLQDVREFTSFHWSSSDRRRHLRKPDIFRGCAKNGGKIAGD